MRIATSGSVVLAFIFAASATAQQPAQPASVEAVKLALQKAPQASLLIPPALQWVTPAPIRIGVFTFVPPESRGEMVRVAVPVGDLVSRPAHAASSAQRRRAQRNAHEEVVRDLQAFQAREPSR